MENIVAFIPARGGSKRIPKKNIKSFAGKPLIGWTIEQALESQYINEVIVSTDDYEIAKVAMEYGAKVPFLRPPEISGDLSTDFEAAFHYLSTCKTKKDVPDVIVHLRPTYPTRTTKMIDDALEYFLNKDNDDCSSLRSVVVNDKPAFKMYRIQNNTLIPLFKKVDNIEEPYNCPAQLLPTTYWHNGCIDIFWSNTILKDNSISGIKILPWIMNPNEIDDIDTIEEWEAAENKIRASMSVNGV